VTCETHDGKIVDECYARAAEAEVEVEGKGKKEE
jgi:hypothetical protein